MQQTKSDGFTLIELAIVLVIIGLVVGGIMAGQTLIHQSELRSMTTQAERVKVAINNFRTKYNAAPGEFYLYRSVWPTMATSYCYGPWFSAGSNTNGIIDTGFEIENALAQLYAAGMIEYGRPQILIDGTVRPTWDCFANNMQQQAGLYTKLPGGPVAVFNANYGALFGTTILTFGTIQAPPLTVLDALSVDIKFDDGKPYAGSIRNFRSTQSGYCTSTSTITDQTATYYKPSLNDKTCWPHILLY